MNKWLKQDLWRHLVGIAICLFALFPLYLVIISSFSSSGSLQLSSFLPREISFANYDKLFNDPTIPYLTWVKNSLLIAGSVAVFSVIIGTASAFAFSRLKFKGRKFGIQLLLLVQMFPAILAISAVYVIMERVYKFAPEIGLGTHFGSLIPRRYGKPNCCSWFTTVYWRTVFTKLGTICCRIHSCFNPNRHNFLVTTEIHRQWINGRFG